MVELLAEPRVHVSYREICRRCHVTDDTVKAIERREAVPVAARKQELMVQAARIPKRAADRVEDEIDNAPLPQAVVTFGVMTDKIVALSNDPQQINLSHSHSHDLAQSLHNELRALAAQLEESVRLKRAQVAESSLPQATLPNRESVPDSGAETG